MSSERFDKLMKKNLEAVRPNYQPRAWDRFRKRLPMPGFWPWLGQYGGWLLSGFMLAGWMTTLYTLHENRRVLERMNRTRAATSQTVVSQPAAPATLSASPRRIDTVYIVKRTVVEHRHYYRPMSEDATNSNPVPSNEAATGSMGDGEKAVTTTRKNETYLRNQPGFRLRLAESAERIATNRSGKTPNRVLPTDSRPPTSPDSTQTPATPDPAPDEKQGVADDPVKPTPQSLQKSVPLDSAKQTVAATAVPLKPPIPKIEPKRQPFRLSSLRPRGGIETLITRNSLGVGPVTEVFPMENLGISVGLQASQQNSEKHRGLKDFNSATGLEFIEQYRPYLPAQFDKIEEISIKTTGVSLPVNLKYYVPLEQKWSLLFQTGTNLELAAYQQIKYESFFRGDEQHHSFNLKSDHQFFHNFLFGGGVQFRQSRTTAQLIPYFLYDFRGEHGNSFGIKASVWLDLFK
ncbi:hypothetical protein GCM10028803_00670 [Larkinella knui]|uniref:Outer membrane protein beta-barrel domain-containing protein n=1 Tax=Larkinella knui TaxID=2025310 RepID=A0A3P1CLL3_9BACT|nr:hypothetical protein [Larkinella knui]RRB14222.1 hypothetical protein EHT87_18485 [Larkinella knui]